MLLPCVSRTFARFLPTPSARRATFEAWQAARLAAISTHALREEGDGLTVMTINILGTISTHALREEGDMMLTSASTVLSGFLPTPSARRATGGHHPAF